MDELAELQKEFRASVLGGLSDLKRSHQLIEKDLQDIRLKMIDGTVINDLQTRVTSLEKTKTQLVTAIVVIQGVFVAINTWFGK
jgi:hypothetical protein